MDDSSKKIFIPSNWNIEPKVATLSQLKLTRREIITGAAQEINKKSDRYLNDIQQDKQIKRINQGLSLIPQDFPKKTVEFSYNRFPLTPKSTQSHHSPFSQQEFQTLGPQIPSLSKPSVQLPRSPHLLILPKLPPNRKDSSSSPLNPDQISLCQYKSPSFRQDSITPKPTEVRYEDYSNKYIFAKSKPVFRKKLNFLDIFNKDSRDPASWHNEDSTTKNMRNKSMRITNRLRHKFERSTSKLLTSGFNN